MTLLCHWRLRVIQLLRRLFVRRMLDIRQILLRAGDLRSADTPVRVFGQR